MSDSREHWTVVIDVTSRDVNTETIRQSLDLIEGVECVAISFDEDDATRVLGLEPDTLVVDVRSKRACGYLMVGSGTDSYDPLCELPQGHDGLCKSTAAVDQRRLSLAEKRRAWQ